MANATAQTVAGAGRTDEMGELVDVALAFACDYYRLRAAAIRGDVRAQRRGRRWYVHRGDVARWARAQAPAQGPAAK